MYPRPFWREEGLNGQALGDLGAAPMVFDNSPPDARVGILTAFLAGTHTHPLAPTGPLVWAGAEQAHTWNGYMDGAVRSGEHAAALVAEELSSGGGT